MALICAVWGSTWLVIKYGLRDIPPFTGASLRFFVAAAVMALVARIWAKREGGGRPPLSVIAAQGVFQFALNYGLVYVGETVIPSGLVSVLWAVFPLFIGLAGHFVLKTERLRGPQWLGIALALGGVALLFATDLARVSARAVPMGLLVLLAPLSVTVSTLMIKQRAAGSSSLILNRDSMLIGAVVLGACAFFCERGRALVFTPVAIAAVLYLALAGTVLTFGLYLWLLRYVPAYRLSLISFVTPVVALLVGATIGGEPLGVHTLLGTALVLTGVGFTLLKGKPTVA
ncbi:MAG TPA: EamA family transporter [Polyangiaceae bacterium]|jgi:drug/metabolite transporter (DMT)-like permease